jgi:hypothetical protein
MTWMRLALDSTAACCPWPQHCRCRPSRARVMPPPMRRGPRVASTRAPNAPLDLCRSGDDWERVLQRLASLDARAARRARRQDPWGCTEAPR